MSLDIFTQCQCHCLTAAVFANQTTITVDGTSNWPDLSLPENAGRTFLLQLKSCSSGLIETVRVTATMGNVLTVVRAVGYNETQLDFCVGDQVCSIFGETLSEALNEIIDCIIDAQGCDCVFQVGEGPNGSACLDIAQVGDTITITNLINMEGIEAGAPPDINPDSVAAEVFAGWEACEAQFRAITGAGCAATTIESNGIVVRVAPGDHAGPGCVQMASISELEDTQPQASYDNSGTTGNIVGAAARVVSAESFWHFGNAQTGTQRTRFGVNSLPYNPGGADAQFSVAFGGNAGRTNLADFNTYIGASAGELSAGPVTAVGAFAAQNVNASFTTAVGQSAARNFIGNSVTAIGNSAGTNATATNNATYIGILAGNNSSGDAVTLIGEQNGLNNTGDTVVAVGTSAAIDNTGDRVAVVGNVAAQENIGDAIAGIGHEVFSFNQGSRLAAIGDDAMTRNIGNDSVGGGYRAGYANQGDDAAGVGVTSLTFNVGDCVAGLGSQTARYNGCDQFTAIGCQAGSSFIDGVDLATAVPAVNFDVANQCVTVVGHGVPIGAGVIVRFDPILPGQVSAITPLVATDANTLCIPADFQDPDVTFNAQPAGTTDIISPDEVNCVNATVIGYNTQAVRGANQVTLGNALITDVHGGQAQQADFNGAAFNIISDENKKDILGDAAVDEMMKAISKLSLKRFKYKEGKTHEKLGFVAQDVMGLLPQVVNGDEGNMTIDISQVATLCLALVSRLNQRLTALEAA